MEIFHEDDNNANDEDGVAVCVERSVWLLDTYIYIQQQTGMLLYGG